VGFVRPLIESSTSIICFLKRHRRVPPDHFDGLVKVNLGCGLTTAPGWVNIDGSINGLVSSLPAIIQKVAYRFSGARDYYSLEDYRRILTVNKFIHHNLEYGIPLTNECADFVYSSHLLEHLRKEAAMNLMKEIFRILKPGGRIRIVVPDLEFAVSLFNKGEKKRMLEDFFFVEQRGSSFARHKYMYDFELLKELLENGGLRDVTRCEFQKGRVPDIELLDNQPDISLYLEATKP
jgi:SAM-dependent methyltransferase